MECPGEEEGTEPCQDFFNGALAEEGARRSIRERIPKGVRRWLARKDRVPCGARAQPAICVVGQPPGYSIVSTFGCPPSSWPAGAPSEWPPLFSSRPSGCCRALRHGSATASVAIAQARADG